jgi:hypothetical protein
MTARTRTTNDTPEQIEDAAKKLAEKITPPAATAVETPAETPAATPEKSPEIPFDWDALPEVEEATYTRGPSTIDVDAETPARIKADLTKSFEKFDATANDGKGQAFWLMLSLPNADAALQYLKLAKRYAIYREWTLRGGPSASDPAKIRFCAKPKETRKRPSF